MKAFTTMLLLGLGLSAQLGFAQAPAVISAPIAESSSRKQIVHQGVSTTLLGRGKALAGDMQVVSGKIKGIVDQTQALHAQWYSSLLQISAGVRNYRRVREIYAAQASMISQFSSGVADLRGRGLSPNQVTEAAQIYQVLLQENVALIGELATIMTTNRAEMTDPQRIKFINKIGDQMQQQQYLMSYYTNKCRAVALSQQQVLQDRASVLTLVGARP